MKFVPKGKLAKKGKEDDYNPNGKSKIRNHFVENRSIKLFWHKQQIDKIWNRKKGDGSHIE